MARRAGSVDDATDKLTKRRPVDARPQGKTDRQSLRAKINKHFSKSLEHLSR